MEKPVINLDLLEPEAIQQLHGNLAQQIDGMQQARYNMTKIAELLLATDSNLCDYCKFFSFVKKKPVDRGKTNT